MQYLKNQKKIYLIILFLTIVFVFNSINFLFLNVHLNFYNIFIYLSFCSYFIIRSIVLPMFNGVDFFSVFPIRFIFIGIVGLILDATKFTAFILSKFNFNDKIEALKIK